VVKILQHNKIWGAIIPLQILGGGQVLSYPRDLHPCSYLCYCMTL